jgi:Fe-Mn family superoxide dismutase
VQGSGRGVLAWEPLSRRLIVEQVYDHHGNVGQGSTPLLVFDAWNTPFTCSTATSARTTSTTLEPRQLDRRHRPLRRRPRQPTQDLTPVGHSEPVHTAETVQRAAGVIAARRRGDFDGAEALLAAFPAEAAKTLGSFLRADLALGLLQAQLGQSMDDLGRELTLHLATAADHPPASKESNSMRDSRRRQRKKTPTATADVSDLAIPKLYYLEDLPSCVNRSCPLRRR